MRETKVDFGHSQGGDTNVRPRVGRWGRRGHRRLRPNLLLLLLLRLGRRWTSFWRLTSCRSRCWHIDNDRWCQTLTLRIRIPPAGHGGRNVFDRRRIRRTLWKTLQGNSFHFLWCLLGRSEPGNGHVDLVRRILFLNVILDSRTTTLLLLQKYDSRRLIHAGTGVCSFLSPDRTCLERSTRSGRSAWWCPTVHG